MKNLAIYIHWPFCKSKCPYCDFNSHVRERVEQDAWRNALISELEFMHSHSQNFTVSSIFFGGGTPSLMPPATAEALINRVHKLWNVRDDIEITLEANPTSVESENFNAFKAAGINRVSLGVQSLRDDELKFLGRGHSASEAIKAIKLAQKTFARYSFDLIYARPNQTIADWDAELTEALALTGGHLSLYQLTIEENTAFYHAYKNGGFAMPSEELAEELYIRTEEKMLEHGFTPYEISNYAKAGEESRHNLSYWQGDSYIGIGAGAHGRINTGGKRIATQTLKSPERWLENVQKSGNAVEIWQEIPPEIEVEERLMMGLRLRGGINYEDFKSQTGLDLHEHINTQKRDFYIKNGLLADDANNLRPTLKGKLVLNKLTAELIL